MDPPLDPGETFARIADPPLLRRPPSPSYLIAIANFAQNFGRNGVVSSSKEIGHAVVVRNVAAMCDAGLNVAFVVDAAFARRSYWRGLLRSHGCNGSLCRVGERPLWCERRKEAVEAVIRRFAPADVAGGPGDGYNQLAGAHVQLFKANLDRFDWFLYSEDDVAWTWRTLLAFRAEYAILSRHARSTTEGMLEALPGAVRWEPLATHSELNDRAQKSTDRTKTVNDDVPLEAVLAVDWSWRPATGVKGIAIGGERYIAARNPFSAMYLLPRSELAKRWGSGVPTCPTRAGACHPVEFFAGGWLWAHSLDEHVALAGEPRGTATMVVPCRRVRDFLVMHMSGGKFSKVAEEVTAPLYFVQMLRDAGCEGA